jgi:two-component system sensor histidine kinase CpxA
VRLRTKILLCAAANVVLLSLAVAVFVRLQFRPGVESILLAPGEERVRRLADQIAADLPKSPAVEWNALLSRYARAHGVDLGLVLNETRVALAGTIQTIPDGLVVRRFPGLILGPPHPAVIPGNPVFIRVDSTFNLNLIATAAREPESVSFFSESGPKRYWFQVGIPIRWTEHGSGSPGTLLVRSSSILFKPLLFDSRPWLACLAAIFGITLLCWTPLIRGLTRSVRQITAAAEQIAEGRFDVETGVHRGDEIGQLNDAIHRMAAQLSGFVTGQRRFLGDIAHELCAPIARTRVALGVLEERAEHSAEPAQKQYVQTAEEEMEHMSGLVNELLQFSKAALSAQEPAAEPVGIADLAARVIEREAGQDGRVRLASGGELRVLAQPGGLFRAVSNVVRNGLRYAGSHGSITISARRDGEHVLLSVADQGPGLPEDALDRVFTPFYRLDDSRSRESSGVGLGLAMVKSLVEASGGSVSCRNLSPSGLEVTLRLRGA